MQRLLEESQRLSVGRARRGLRAGSAEVGNRPVPQLSSNGMVGEALEVFGEPVAIEPFDRFGDPCMKLAATPLEKRSVRDVVGEGVLEGVFGFGKEVHFIKEFGSDEIGEPPLQIRLGRLGNLA